VKSEFEALCKAEKISENAYTRIAAQEISGTSSLTEDLARSMSAVAKEIDHHVQSYSSVDWLLYLRTPIIRKLTTWAADGMETAHHAEALTANSVQQTTGFRVEEKGILLNWDSRRLRRVAQLVGGAFIYRQLRVFRSMLAMDVSFRQSEPKLYPIDAPSDDQRERPTGP
jgi:hypothetical protein